MYNKLGRLRTNKCIKFSLAISIYKSLRQLREESRKIAGTGPTFSLPSFCFSIRFRRNKFVQGITDFPLRVTELFL